MVKKIDFTGKKLAVAPMSKRALEKGKAPLRGKKKSAAGMRKIPTNGWEM